ncbi:MAG TPA: hypothetical protein VF516_32220, partial [Kofleriaceae bacterium]
MTHPYPTRALRGSTAPVQALRGRRRRSAASVGGSRCYLGTPVAAPRDMPMAVDPAARSPARLACAFLAALAAVGCH